MARSGVIKHVRKAGAFTNGELNAGEWGLDVTNGVWYFSRNGTTVEQPAGGGGGGATNLDGLTDVAIAALAAGHVLSYDGTTWINRTLANAGIVATALLGAANGVATLGADSKLTASQVPAIAVTDVHTVVSQAAQLALTAEEGDVAIRTDTGVTYIHNGGSAGTMADWTILPANDTAIDATHITSGNLDATRYSATVIAALNAAPAGTIANANIIIDAGTL